MPNFDRTGPEGKGKKTGRQLGKCEDRTPLERPRCGRKFRGRQ